jgi:dethiobiotin synthetase
MNNGYFVTGTGTGVGKTIASAILCEALEADYWKPVQCGVSDGTDTQLVKSIVSGNDFRVIPEQFVFSEAQSPHFASAKENRQIHLKDFKFPATSKTIIVEGAGGIMVPLNMKGEYVIDLAGQLQVPVILVAGYYLGAINHLLMSLECLSVKNYQPVLIILNGQWPGFAVDSALRHAPALNFIQFPDFKYINKVELKAFAESQAGRLKLLLNKDKVVSSLD